MIQGKKRNPWSSEEELDEADDSDVSNLDLDVPVKERVPRRAGSLQLKSALFPIPTPTVIPVCFVQAER